MASIDHEIMRLRDELERQKALHEKTLSLVKSELRQTHIEIEKLQSIKAAELPVKIVSPDENTAAPKKGRFFQNGDRMPDDQELLSVWGTAQETEIFAELQDWIDRDRIEKEIQRKAGVRPDEPRWFCNGKQPTMSEMADPKSLQLMLKELDSMK